MSSLKERVRLVMTEFRKKRELNQADFARKMGCTKQHVANLETGRAVWTLDDIDKVARAFNCQPEAIFADMREGLID